MVPRREESPERFAENLRGRLAAAHQKPERGCFADLSLMLKDLLVWGRRAPSIFDNLSPTLLGAAESAGVASNEELDFHRALLTLIHLSPLRKDIARHAAVDRWMNWSLEAINAARWTTGALFRTHASIEPNKTLFLEPGERFVKEVSWRDAEEKIELIARGLNAFLRESDGRWKEETRPVQVAILSENRLEGALFDLACLTTGIPNVVIPPRMIPEHLEQVLQETRPSLLIVSTLQQLEKIHPWAERCPSLKGVVVLDCEGSDIFHPDDLLEMGQDLPMETVLEWESRVVPADIATYMYTSGTTGRPKGLIFTHRNLVSKRIARALALPELGSDDRFLCFLPLAHTFGRWFEMLGSIFWRATYVFLLDPSRDGMLRALNRYHPTSFISVPQKWIQLYEMVTSRTAKDGPQHLVQQLVSEITGGRLKWGLSAAGYLDPAIFHFFQDMGIDLVSGFGMTEATGGITMTPPGNYAAGSVGPPLPGIELKIAEDGELLLRGPYVARIYDSENPDTNNPEVDWFATGDLAAIDSRGYYSIVGRKKDLFKNVKGETIAPQRAENLLQSFPEVEQAVLVGDGRPFNVVLIHTRGDAPPGDPDVRERISNIVASVNRFLASYERIVDFALLPRPLDIDRGELTAKGTPRRETVEEHFSHLLHELYRSAGWHGLVNEVEVRVPEWIFRHIGRTIGDLEAIPSGLAWHGEKKTLTLKWLDPIGGIIQVGSLVYQAGSGRFHHLDLEDFLRIPVLWLGNVELVDFLYGTLLRLPRRRRTVREPFVVEAASPGSWSDVINIWSPTDAQQCLGLECLHRALTAAQWSEEQTAVAAVQWIASLLDSPSPDRSQLSRSLLRRLLTDARLPVATEALIHLLPRESEKELEQTLASYADRHPESIDEEIFARITQASLSPAQLRRLSHMACQEVRDHPKNPTRGQWLLEFFRFMGPRRPQCYPYIREALASWYFLGPEPMRLRARVLLFELRENYRRELEAEMPLVRVEHIQFSASLRPEIRNRTRRLLTKTACVADAVEVLSGGSLSARRLDEASIFVEPEKWSRDQQILRVIVNLPGGATCEFLLRPEMDRPPEKILEDIWWYLLLEISGPRGPLTPHVGGYWKQYGVWTSMTSPFLPVDVLLDQLEQQVIRRDPRGRAGAWTHLAWSALTAFIEFWDRTGRHSMLSDPSPRRVGAPLHDYQEGTRLLSLGPLETAGSLRRLFEVLWERFVQYIENDRPSLKGIVTWDILFSAFVEAVGPTEGIPLLAGVLELEARFEGVTWKADLETYLQNVAAGGFRARRLTMAAARYHRWIERNPEVSWVAKARTLSEIYETYHLTSMETDYPETRIRVFLETVFADARKELVLELEALLQKARKHRIGFDGLLDWVTNLHQKLPLGEDEVYFLARLTYGSLTPGREAAWMILDRGTGPKLELIIARRDSLGNEVWIRPPAQPSEIVQLHQHFQEEGLHVHFQPDHDYLLLVDQKEHVLGGLFYREFSPKAVHMEKIVIGHSRRGRGLGAALMEEFCSQSRDRGYDV
ncbi:MAG: AMP-binding protein, partial [Candidatus Eisenbacteria bacterium]|nr:AMP-binding protein [Candidatus Eisenbacteria bacterium]